MDTTRNGVSNAGSSASAIAKPAARAALTKDATLVTSAFDLGSIRNLTAL
jgi:hypothetical protein